MGSCQKVQNLTFKVNFLCQKSSESFSFFSLKNTNLGAHLSLIFLLISNLINKLRLHQFLGTKTIEANKSLKTDANGAY